MNQRGIENNQTIEQMWKNFVRQATRNSPGRAVSGEVRAAYYAGCHNMLGNMLSMMRSGEATPGAWAAAWQKWSDELAQFSQDYNDGKF